MSKSDTNSEALKTGQSGLAQNLRYDLKAGFLVFLIALPLCLGISLACGYPAIAGIFTAVIGAVLTTFISNSQLTIKGPAAGLIVIAIGAVIDFGFTGGRDPAADYQAYRMALGVGVAAGCFQVLFGLLRVGSIGDFFPLCAVHGMLAAIGIIIILKQFPIALGGHAEGEPFELMTRIPSVIIHMNPYIAAIGIGSLAIMFGIPLVKHKHKIFQMIPPPMFVLFFAVPLGLYFGISEERTYLFEGHEYHLGKQFLVDVPSNMFKAVAYPDFSSLKSVMGWKWVIMFALIGSIESLLSAKAIDIIDPWKRKTNLNRDLLAVGIGNTLCAFVGGLPMISEIVRSKANIDNGARTRFANMFHGLFLLIFVAAIPFLLCKIPLAALAAMLVYTGFQLTAPREYVHTYKIGVEQLIIFVATVVAVLATDLVIGIAVGIGAKFFIHIINGVPLRSLFRPYLDVKIKDENTVVVFSSDSAVFSNWIPFKKQLEHAGIGQGKNVILNMSKTKLIDHSVMGKLKEVKRDFKEKNLKFEIVGLESHKSLSDHELATRKRSRELILRKRVCVLASATLLTQLKKVFKDLEIVEFTMIESAKKMTDTVSSARSLVRVESLLQAEKANELLECFREQILPKHPATVVWVENVEAVLPYYKAKSREKKQSSDMEND
ncbi:MAG: SulP family inorganic anion transporter [Candidatus Brocadiaceae bacterium]|nr:SulP family inorganic anion transporter [Candidatus Brocadiaceae bacterium]